MTLTSGHSTGHCSESHDSQRVFGDTPATIIPHGCPESLAPHVRVKSSKIRIAYVGLASIEKGWQAFREVALKMQDDSRFELSVIGYVDPQCDTRGLDRVRFAGAYHESELAAYLQNVDIAVPACMLVESYGIVIDECLAAGCLVVVPGWTYCGSDLVILSTYQFGDGDSLDASIRSTVAVFNTPAIARLIHKSVPPNAPAVRLRFIGRWWDEAPWCKLDYRRFRDSQCLTWPGRSGVYD